MRRSVLPATNAALIDEVYAPLLLGRDALDRETRWLELYTAMRDHGRKGTALEALSAVDIALWDLAGKHFGVSCHRLAGRNYRRHVAAYATGFYRKRAAGVPDRPGTRCWWRRPCATSKRASPP